VSHPRGTAGRLAAAFLDSRLTPLLTAAAIALGAFAVFALPREEEPQIVVPMIDVMVAMPGASPAEVERRVTAPLERLLWELPGVEYIYATSSPGQSLVIVRFVVGHEEERALVLLNQKIDANLDIIPPGVSPPLIKPRSIDDVPILALTLWSDRYDAFVLRQVASELQDAIKQVPNVSEVAITGGAKRELSVDLDPARLAAYGIDPLAAREALRQANVSDGASVAPAADAQSLLQGGRWLTSSTAVGETIVGGTQTSPVRLRDVADIRDGDAEPSSYVTFASRASGTRPAVSLTVAKRAGTNAIDVVHAVEQKLALVRGRVVPSDVRLTVTRNYGETAAEKSNELLFHMLLAVLSVSLLIWIALGRREAAVVLVAIPVTLALTLFVFYLYGYTLNRITLFALIFSIGILVDDAIVVVENIVRHTRMAGVSDRQAFAALAIRAVDEVGNPTILATLTVVAAILPMAFVGGLMGPYMRPIPVGAAAAMLFSLLVAFVVTPWASVRLLRRRGGHHDERENRMTALYRRVMGALIRSPRARWSFLSTVAALLVLSMLLVPLKLVTVKMLPFDNKSEFQVIVNMPEGTALERTAQVAGALADAVLADAAVTTVQTYTGTSSPYNFNGLVRHYFLRQAPHQADLQVNLLPRGDRDEQSHAIARRVRERLIPIAAAAGARIQVAEVPPGPPVLQTLVAEVYGADPAVREDLASRVRDAFRGTPGVVDVDWYVEERQPKVTLAVDPQRAAAAGVSAAAVAAAVRMAGSGEAAGLLHDNASREDVPIVLRLSRENRDLASLRHLRIGVPPVAIGELTDQTMSRESPSLYRKNLQPVTYVTADLAGAQESPVYAILQLDPQVRAWTVGGRAVDTFSATQPVDGNRYAVKWDGEWHITYEVFRDLGFAFAAVLILIYLLVVGWFQSFSTPVAIMAAIPFSLVGILPAHAAMGAFFTATSMIGFIAGAGIVVRNSIILVDFIELRLREGLPLEQAVVDAGAVRFRPMALTAAAVIAGSAVILFDPIFQGLAIALMAGEVASLFLSRMTVPVLYFLMARGRATQPAVPATTHLEVA
jgi:multidrug efflux pump subunit AcrB